MSTTKGTYACLGGSCGYGCGTPNVGDAKCIQYMTLGDSQVGWRVREAVQHLHAVPWFVKPRVYRSPEVCTFRQMASPGARGEMVGKSDWEVVQRAFAPFNSVLHPGAGEQGCYQPFDMPMAHIECHDEGATIANTELVVFRKSHPSETRAAFWQRIVRDSEDRAAIDAKDSNSVEVLVVAIGNRPILFFDLLLSIAYR